MDEEVSKRNRKGKRMAGERGMMRRGGGGGRRERKEYREKKAEQWESEVVCSGGDGRAEVKVEASTTVSRGKVRELIV